MNCVNDRELDEYIDRVIGTMSDDQLSELEQSPYPYVVKIQGKVKELMPSIAPASLIPGWSRTRFPACPTMRCQR